MRHARLGAGVAVVMLLGGCGSVVGPGPGEQTTATAISAVAGWPQCRDTPRPAADPSVYRDTPRYGNADEVVARVLPWAQSQPGFAELWLDRDRNGWVTLGFRDADVAALQAAVEAEFPGDGIAVVSVPDPGTDLEALQRRVHEALTDAGVQHVGSSVDVVGGVVAVDVAAPRDEVEEGLRPFAGEPICVSLVEPIDAAPEGPQPDSGPGWRLLGAATGVGDVYVTGVATTPAQLDGLWSDSGLDGEAPAVDFGTEIVVWFGAVYGSGCPIRLDDVLVTDGVLHGDFAISNGALACNEDANPHSFVVAVERGLLPQGPFGVQLDAEEPPPGAPEELTQVDVDLSAPGATATDEQIHPDPNWAERVAPDVVEDGATLDPNESYTYLWQPDPECGLRVLGEFDGITWRLADDAEVPEEMETLAAEGAGLEMTLFPLDEHGLVASHAVTELFFVPAEPGFTC